MGLTVQSGSAITFVSGSTTEADQGVHKPSQEIGKWEVLKNGENCSILAVGSMVDIAMNGYNQICNEIGYNPTLINARFIKPIDTKLLDEIFSKNDVIVTMEEGSKIGGFGSFVLNYANSVNYKGKIHILGINDKFIDQGSRKDLLKYCGLSIESVIESIVNG